MPNVSFRFYLLQICLLAIAGVCLILLFEFTQLDFYISDRFFDPLTGTFLSREEWFFSVFNHRWLKYGLYGVAAVLLVRLFMASDPIRRRKFLFVLLCFGLVPGIISILKHNSDRPCPWYMARYGGPVLHQPLWEKSYHSLDSMKKCFPGGHASAGFATLAFGFLWYPKNKQKAWAAWLLALGLGLFMGWGQVVRGAHLFSHNCWSAWFAWATIIVLHALFFSRKQNYSLLK